MSEDQYTEVTTTSWFERIKNSLSAIIFGIVLFLAAFFLLFWNEGRSVHRAQALEAGEKAVIAVDNNIINPENEGKLIHITGKTEVTETLQDASFGISAQAIKLQRVVEMYQWQEHTHSETKEKIGGGEETVTTYTYDKSWSEHLIDSNGFHIPEGHQNPSSFTFEQARFIAEKVTLGAFRLSEALISRLGNYQKIDLDKETLEDKIPQGLNITSNYIYKGNALVPEIGDERISFKAVYPSDISIIAQQHQDSFAQYKTKTGEILLLQQGLKTPEEMFQAAKAQNNLVTWLLRLAGVAMMYFGLMMILGVIRTIASVIPFLGSIVGAGLHLISLAISISFSLITIAIAWMYYRPLVGIILIIVGIVLSLGILKLNRKPVSVEN